MSTFGTGSTGNEDLVFSLGLDGITLVDNLDSTEQKVAQSLGKIGKSFKDLKTVVDDAGKNNQFKTNLTETSKTANTLTAQLRALLTELRAVNAELAKTRASSSATGALNAQLATVGKLQAAVAKLQAQTFNTGSKIGLAAANAVKNLSQVANQATNAAGKVQNLGQNANNAGNNLQNAGNKGAAAMKKIGLSGQTLNQQFQQTGGYLRNISTVLSTIGLGGGIFALIYGFKQLVKDGIDFNAQVEQAKISLAAEIVASSKMVEVDGQRVEGLRAIQAVQGQVGEIVGQLKTDALFVNGTFEDLLGIAQSITPQIARMGGNLTQVHRLTQLTGIAASVLNVEFKTAQTGLSQLLNGNVVGRNAFVRRLPIPVDELKAGLKDVNGRAEFLIKTLAKLEDAGPLIMTSFKGAFESMKDLLQQVSGRAFEPLQKRLQGGFNSFISANVLKGSDGTMQYSKELEATITRVSRLVDTLLAQVTLVARELFGGGGRSFLDVAEETLPKVISGLGNLLSFLGAIGGFLTQHAGLVLKLVGYYMTFNVVVGVFNSVWGVVTKVNGAIMALQGLMVTATSSTMGMSGAITFLSGALQALATKFLVGLLIVAVMEMISHFMDARQAAADMKIALDDLNNLNFDTAIGQIRKLTQEIKEGEGWWDKLWSLGKTKQDAQGINKLTEKAVQKSFDVLSSLGIGSPVHFYGMPINPSTGKPEMRDTGLDATDIAGSARKIGQGIEIIRKQQDALQDEARTASDKRREDIKTELGELAKKNEALRSALSLLKENTLAAQALSATEEGRKQLGNTKIALFGKAGEDVAAVEAGLNLSPRTVVTPNKTVTPPDADAARRLLRNESALVNALEQVSQASSRVLDRTYQRQQSDLDLLVQKHIYTVQQAADKETQIAKDTAAAKIGVQESLFKKLDENKLVDLSGAKAALGLGNGNLTFAELRGVSQEQIAQAMADMQVKAETPDKDKQAQFQKQIHDLEILGKIVAAINTEEEKLASAISDNARRKEKAEETATNDIKEQKSLMADRNAELDVEEAKLFDITGSLDERIKREQALTNLIIARSKEDIGKKAQKEIDSITAKTDWTPEQKSTAVSAINADADRQKKFQAAKELIDLQNRLIQLKDQEIEMDANGTHIKETELGTLKALLGAENPLVAAKENELILEKAHTLELQAQARYEAANALSASGQNTAAKLARNAGDILMAQAAALRAETKNYLDVIGGVITELSGLLGRFSGTLGNFSQGLGSLFGQIGKLSKIDIGATFNAGKGGATGLLGAVKGAASVAGPIAAVASTAMGLFQTFFDIFQAGWKKLLDAAHDKIQDALDTTLGNLRAGRSTLQQTIDDLKNQAAHVEDKYPKAKGGAPWYSWLMPVVGASISVYNGLSDKARQEAIDADKLALGKQIEQMAKDAQEALYTLEHDTLPALRVTPAMREFESSIEKIRTELQQLAGTPGISQSDLNEMFSLRIADLQSGAMDTLLTQEQEYYDILKQEKDLKSQLADLDKEQAQAELDYKNQRAQILGLATRELSKSEQLAKLKTDEQAKLDDIAKRREDLQAQLDYVEKQKAVYESVFGVVQDMGKYETDIQDQLLAKTKERLTSLQTFLQEIKDWMNSGVWNFITNNGATTANGNPYALPVVLVNPQPISNPDPTTNPGTGNIGGDQVNYNMYGDINVNGNMTQAEAKQSFLDAWRSFNQENAVRGLAHSNA